MKTQLVAVHPKASRHARPRSRLVRSVIAEKRREHSQLRGDVTFDGFLDVLRIEMITLRWQEIRPGVLGRAIAYMGHACIILNPCLAGSELLHVALHELGHVHLHVFDPAQRIRGAGDDPRAETEADLYASLLLQGSASMNQG